MVKVLILYREKRIVKIFMYFVISCFVLSWLIGVILPIVVIF